MKKGSTDHVVIDVGTKENPSDGAWLCKRCGQRLLMPLPVLVSVYVAAAKAFAAAHARCRGKR
jgi:hypothetical protein